MFEAISKIFESVKDSGWLAAMLAVASGLFLYLASVGTIPPLEPWMVVVAWAVLLTAAAVAAAAVASAVQRVGTRLVARGMARRARIKAGRAFRDYIPHLTDRERQILGYLREKNQKTFVADHDGGYAATLLARGIVTYVGVRGQSFDMDKVPMAVPDYVWKVMVERPQDFPYKPLLNEHEREVHPWRISWMAR